MIKQDNIAINQDSTQIKQECPALPSHGTVNPEASAVNFSSILAPAKADFAAVNLRIQEALKSDVPLIAEVNDYLINSGGKRLRPLIALLCGQTLGQTGDPRQHNLATAVEFLHNATLLHDDVVDDSSLRRGKKTSHTVWGNATSILVGDFLISRALQLLTQIGSMGVLEVFARTTNLIAEGEVLQLLHCKNPDTSLAQYREVIERKTARMFEAAARGAAMIAGCEPALIEALSSYALHLGNSFQMIDDALDYTGDPQSIGKSIGDDLAEGKITLPLLLALNTGSEHERKELRSLVRNHNGSSTKMTVIIDKVLACGAIEKTHGFARQEIDLALTHLHSAPESPAKNALQLLARYSLARTH